MCQYNKITRIPEAAIAPRSCSKVVRSEKAFLCFPIDYSINTPIPNDRVRLGAFDWKANKRMLDRQKPSVNTAVSHCRESSHSDGEYDWNITEFIAKLTRFKIIIKRVYVQFMSLIPLTGKKKACCYNSWLLSDKI